MAHQEVVFFENPLLLGGARLFRNAKAYMLSEAILLGEKQCPSTLVVLVVGVQSVRFNAEHDFVIAAAVWLRRFRFFCSAPRYISAIYSAIYSAFWGAFFSATKRRQSRTARSGCRGLFEGASFCMREAHT